MTALLGLGLFFGAGAQAQTTERVSVSSDGTQANRDSYGAFPSAISATGRFVTFSSDATNLVAGDTNDRQDIFVHDRDLGTTERVSVASDGTESIVASANPAISADGRFVAFLSFASDLVAGDTNGVNDVFVHDRESGTTERVSVASDGTEGDSLVFRPAISADGRFVAFWSRASNLVEGDTNDADDIFVHDRDSGSTERVSVASDGTEGNGRSSSPAISADGRLVAFASRATNLVEDDTNGRRDVFVHDRDTGVTKRVSVASDGNQGNNSSGIPSISADGRFVAFSSTTSNLIEGDTNGWADIFVHDRETGTTELVSVASDGTQGNTSSGEAAISADGRFVVFSSSATNLVEGDVNDYRDSFVHDRDLGTTERVSVASDGTQGDSFSSSPVISADGRVVAFTSYATNLVEGDTNLSYDIFAHDRGLAPRISIAGDCPGSVSLSLTTATSSGSVAFGWGTTEGSVILPPGPCAGTELGLADPNLLTVLTADLAGSISLDRNVDAGACGRLIQALDLTTCGPSNVASVP